MNPFFWILVLAATVCLWFALRNLFIAIGSKASGLMEDTADILSGKREAENKENEGENHNA